LSRKSEFIKLLTIHVISHSCFEKRYNSGTLSGIRERRRPDEKRHG